jgi:hypothetical protein
MEAGKTTVTVALRLVDGSPMGRVLDEGGAEREFAGWLGFMAVIERAAAAAAAAGNGAGRPRPTSFKPTTRSHRRLDSRHPCP